MRQAIRSAPPGAEDWHVPQLLVDQEPEAEGGALMAIETPSSNPERERMETLIAILEKRVSRAAQKRRAADRDMEEALDDLEAAKTRLSAWVKANPDPQRTIFEAIAGGV